MDTELLKLIVGLSGKSLSVEGIMALSSDKFQGEERKHFDVAENERALICIEALFDVRLINVW